MILICKGTVNVKKDQLYHIVELQCDMMGFFTHCNLIVKVKYYGARRMIEPFPPLIGSTEPQKGSPVLS